MADCVAIACIDSRCRHLAKSPDAAGNHDSASTADELRPEVIEHAIAVARELARSKMVLECDDSYACRSRSELCTAIEARNIPSAQVEDVVDLTFAFANGRGKETPDAFVRCVDLEALAADGEICADDVEAINAGIDEASSEHRHLGNSLGAHPAVAKALALAEAQCLAKYRRDLVRAVEALRALQPNDVPVDVGHSLGRGDAPALLKARAPFAWNQSINGCGHVCLVAGLRAHL